jgi:hypothetical protein
VSQPAAFFLVGVLEFKKFFKMGVGFIYIFFTANLYYAIVFETILTCHRGAPFLQNAIGQNKRVVK